MNLNHPEHNESSGFAQLFRLVIYTAVSLVACSIIGALIVAAIYGLPALSALADAGPEHIGSMRIMLVISSVGLFLIPPLILALVEKRSINKFYNFERPKLAWIGMIIAIFVVSMPVLEWTAAINQKMILPEGLKWLENWMRLKEEETEAVTLMLLDMTSLLDFTVNILMIAIIPAVAEELMFRGAVQRSFGKIFCNPHVAIWLSAFIFSAIHIQFFGFLPRLLLGAAFGYIYFWSGNLWYAIFGHFLNNAYAVSAAWYMKKNNIPLSESEGMHFAWYGYVISFILSILAFLYFKKQTKK